MTAIDQLLIIDIETVSRESHFDKLTPQWQNLWKGKIERQLPDGETAESFFPKRAAILAEFGKIICISAGFFKTEAGKLTFRVKSFAGHDEKTLLQEFLLSAAQFHTAKKTPAFAGHNIREFDIPYICRRMVMQQISIPPFLDFQAMKPWETNLVDTMQYWRFGDFKNYTSLNLLAACLGVESPKEDIDGSMVGAVYWQENNLERIVEYCRKDVVTVAQILLRYQNKPLLLPDDIHWIE